MSTSEERRANGIQRVPVEALVEVCGVGGKQTPFEAESADVSGRGIRLRTAYLPEPGAPVVCRFENAGREVLAEGVVAWCQKQTRGGEFGVKFTALDARSADTLRELCGLDEPVEESHEDQPREQASPNKVASGTKVKLHIEGLGAPMRARVDDGKGSHISVGSSLEFLRIGRKLQMESVDDGSRLEARIEGLDVMIDPGSGVPRLLVLLKTDADEATPQPSVVEAPRKKAARAENGSSAGKSTQGKTSRSSAASTHAEQESAPSDEPTQEQIDAMVGGVRRLASATRNKLTQATLQFGARLGPGMGRALDRVRQISNRQSEPPRRRTTAAPAASQVPERKLRPQMRSVDSEAEATSPALLGKKTRMRRIASGIAATGVLASVVAIASLGGTAKSPSAEAQRDSVAAQSSAVGVGNAAPSKDVSLASGTQQTLGTDGNKLLVNVPLFGPTTMATLERAPVAAASAAEPAALVAAREQALAKATQAALAQGVDVSKLSEEPGGEMAEKSEEASIKPEDVAPFGHGRMKDPILYRLKLDAPGEALRGTSSNKGFTVMIPGRKLLESASGFVKRDPRFAKISSTQSSDGAKITWQFKDDAPPFRVRLRKSAVEILISEGKAPETPAANAKAPSKS